MLGILIIIKDPKIEVRKIMNFVVPDQISKVLYNLILFCDRNLLESTNIEVITIDAFMRRVKMFVILFACSVS